MLEEEEADLYILHLHSQNNEDLNYFSETDRQRVRDIFDILIHDMQDHIVLLKRLLEAEEK